MTWRQFAAALPLLARQRGCTAEEAVALVVACPGPQLNSETGGTGRQSSFSGRGGGSLSGSRPGSVLGGGSDAGLSCESPGDEAAAAGTPRIVGGFTPTKRSPREGSQSGRRSSGGAGAGPSSGRRRSPSGR